MNIPTLAEQHAIDGTGKPAGRYRTTGRFKTEVELRAFVLGTSGTSAVAAAMAGVSVSKVYNIRRGGR